MPDSMIAAIRRVVPTGRRIKGSETFIASFHHRACGPAATRGELEERDVFGKTDLHCFGSWSIGYRHCADFARDWGLATERPGRAFRLCQACDHRRRER